jgi:hypothetical protein
MVDGSLMPPLGSTCIGVGSDKECSEGATGVSGCSEGTSRMSTRMDTGEGTLSEAEGVRAAWLRSRDGRGSESGDRGVRQKPQVESQKQGCGWQGTRSCG